MGRARRTWPLLVAVVAVLLYVLLSTVGLGLLAQVPAAVLRSNGHSVGQEVAFAVSSLGFAVVGAVIVARLPAHPIGWLFVAIALLGGVYHLAFGVVYVAVDRPDGAAVSGMAWLTAWTSPVSGVLLAFAVLLFPDGRPLSARWRVVAWAAALIGVVVFVDYGFAPGPLTDLPTTIANPLGVDALGALRNADAAALIVLVVIAAAASLLVRYHRSRGAERQQLKWLAYAAGLLALLLVLVLVAVATRSATEADPAVAGFLFAVAFSGIPVAAGVAILRYRLYDIDVVINRTLVYGSLTATLATAYLAGVLLLQWALGPLTERSDLAVAGSTLAVAGLFGPARKRIQAVVDRRFYRGRYDAARTLEAFTGRLREQLDLEALAADLRDVARQTVQPTTVSLWVRGHR